MNPAVRARAAPKNGGFTLLELLIALAVIMIVSSGVFMALRTTQRRFLQNAMLTLQADLRYAQRRAVTEGQRIEVIFEPVHNRYRLRAVNTLEEIRIVYLQNGVRLITQRTMIFHPRGTIGNPYRIELQAGNRRYSQQLTTVPSGGRAMISDVTIDHSRR